MQWPSWLHRTPPDPYKLAAQYRIAALRTTDQEQAQQYVRWAEDLEGVGKLPAGANEISKALRAVAYLNANADTAPDLHRAADALDNAVKTVRTKGASEDINGLTFALGSAEANLRELLLELVGLVKDDRINTMEIQNDLRATASIVGDIRASDTRNLDLLQQLADADAEKLKLIKELQAQTVLLRSGFQVFGETLSQLALHTEERFTEHDQQFSVIAARGERLEAALKQLSYDMLGDQLTREKRLALTARLEHDVPALEARVAAQEIALTDLRALIAALRAKQESPT